MTERTPYDEHRSLILRRIGFNPRAKIAFLTNCGPLAERHPPELLHKRLKPHGDPLRAFVGEGEQDG